MQALGMLALSAGDNGGTRLILLLLVLLAIALILGGGIIALLTLRKEHKAHIAHLDSLPESEKL